MSRKMNESDTEKAWNPKNPSVLIVEDEEKLLEIYSRRLKEEGFEVVTCGKAAEAIYFAMNFRFVCVIVDMQLEQGTGQQVIREIRKNVKS